jgi:hypothetical protein
MFLEALEKGMTYRRRDDAFFDSGAGCVQGVVDAVLALFHFDFGCTADLDDGNTAGQLGQTFLQFLAVVVGRGVLDLLADLGTRASMSFFLPAPSTMVVLSLVIVTRLAVPSMSMRDVFQLDAEVFGDDLAAGQDAMSCSMALRRSPKPGALTAATLRPPRSLLTTRVARASPSTSSAMISSGLPD